MLFQRQFQKKSYLRSKHHSLRRQPSLSPPIKKNDAQGKASLCTLKESWKKAGMTVESVFVLPFFFLAMLTMISFMDIYQLQTEKLTKLCQQAKEMGMYAYLTGDKAAELTLPSFSTYEPKVKVIPLPAVRVFNQVKVHTWTGYSAEKDDSKEPGEEMVFVTETGSVYHSSPSCSYLNLKITSAGKAQVKGMRNEYGEKYYPCELCSKDQEPAGTVYLTKTGNRYHNQASCSGLKRTVRLVKKSDVGSNMAACSRCGG